MRMPEGSAPRSTSSTTRLTRVLVLPEPAGARTRAAPRTCSTAARWASSSRTASGPAAGRAAGPGESGCAGAPGCGGTMAAAATDEATSPPSSRPMSSRSSAAASPMSRLRGASRPALNGKPTQNGRPRPTSGWMKRSSTSAACAANSSAVPFQYQRPTGEAPPSSGRPGSPGSPVQSRRAAKRTPGAAAAARCARSRRLATSKNTDLGPANAAPGSVVTCRSSRRLSVALLMMGRPVCVSPGRASDASSPPDAQARVTRVDVGQRVCGRAFGGGRPRAA